MKPSLWPIVAILLAILTLAYSLDTYTATFSTNSLYRKRGSNFPFSFAATPTYPLGRLEQGKTIKVIIDIPYSESGNYPKVRTLRFAIRKGQNVLRRVHEFDRNSCKKDPQRTRTHCQFTFTIPEDENYYFSVTEDQRYLRRKPPIPIFPPNIVIPMIPTALPPGPPPPGPPPLCFPRGPYSQPQPRGAVQWFTVYITYFDPSQPISVGSVNQLVTLLKVTEVRRHEVKRLVYVATRSNYTATLYPVISSDKVRHKRITMYPVRKEINQNNNWRYVRCMGNVLDVPCIQSIDDTKRILTYDTRNAPEDYALQPGYYILTVVFNAKKHPQNLVRFTFQTDRYACPYPKEYPDYYNNFQGCSSLRSPTDKPPCLNFNYVLQICTGCINGYVLNSTDLRGGICLANRTCPDREFFHFGKCYPVNELCGEFDPFTGICLTCGQPEKYDVIEGECIEKDFNCTDRQWYDFDSSGCVDVPDTCTEFDRQTGWCQECINELYQVDDEDGDCKEIILECSENQYQDGLKCADIPATCQIFDRELKICIKCIQGYFNDGTGVCLRILCPERKYPSPTGGECLDVSPLCDEYDKETGLCKSCKPLGYLPFEGICKQVKSALAGCQAAELLGLGGCPPNMQNCRLYDIERRICTDCQLGLYPNFQGVCIPRPNCGPGAIDVNGVCMLRPPNCLIVDDMGLCQRCISIEYRLVSGQCIFSQPCHPSEYRDQRGNCVGIANCLLANPSSNYCITCLNGRPSTSGICCPENEIFFSGRCQSREEAELALMGGNGPPCLIRHPTGYCLRCNLGYVPDYTSPVGCRRTF